MKKIAKRTTICLILVAALAAGMVFYLVGFFANGDDWVSFPVNRHVYSNAQLKVGTVTDRDGEVLATMQDGERYFNNDWTIRNATLHAVGDIEGNIGTGALNFYATELMGYNPVSGAYSVAETGNTLALTLDADLNAVALNALGGRKGAVTLYNYKTGEILCMVSTPAYDPYDPPDEGQLELDSYDGVYINRCLSASFTPGSVFKIVTLAAAIEQLPDLYDMRWHCDGSTVIDGETINCSGVHGDVGIYNATANSCNVAYAELSQLLGGKNIEEYAKKLGLLDSFSVSGIRVAAGSFNRPEDGSYNLSWAGIGQHDDLVNPLAIARMMGAIANGGTAVQPKLVQSLTTEYGLPAGLRYHLRHSERLIKRDTAEQLADILRYDAEEVYDWYYRFAQYEGLSAKSGTAEMTDGKAPHAWFAGYLASDGYPVAFSVVIENAGWGLEQAGAVVDRVLYALIYG